MTKSTTKALLWLSAILGSAICYLFITIFVVEISLMKYLLIELVISVLHAVYNYTKEQALQNIKS
jgi:hypothetical protein